MKKYILTHKWILLFTALFGTLLQGMNVYIQLILGGIVDALVNGQYGIFNRYIVIAVIITVGQYISMAVYVRLAVTYTFKSYRTIGRDFFDSVMNLKFADYSQENSAKYISMLNNDIKQVTDNYFGPVANFSKDVIGVILAVGITAWISPINALISLASGCLLMIAPFIHGKRLSRVQDRQSKVAMLFNEKLKDFFNGFEVIRTYGIIENIKLRFNRVITMYVRALYGNGAVMADVGALMVFVSTGVVFVNYFVAGYFVLRGDISVGDVVAIVAISTTIMQPLGSIAGHLANMTSMKAVSQRVLEIIVQKDNALRIARIKSLDSNIVLKDVSFVYEPDKPPAVNNVSYIFKQRGKYAIVGASGSGKSTLIKLLMGYYDNYTGDVMVNGHNVREIHRDDLHKAFSALHQHVFLFDDTLRNNITLYNTYSTEEYNKAVDKASLTAVQNAQTEGAETELGEGGNTLSGGERQRVSIARALIKGSDVLLCDEATASLDNITATEIENVLIKMDDITCIFTTHKYSADILSKVDGILVMKNGELVEQGTFDQLYQANTHFFELYNEEPAASPIK